MSKYEFKFYLDVVNSLQLDLRDIVETDIFHGKRFDFRRCRHTGVTRRTGVSLCQRRNIQGETT